jgi:phosphatidylglycerol:prolipoprotein diacylglycerol transferase
VLAGIERFLIEFIRRNEPSFIGLTTAQVLSVGMIAAGVAWMAIVRSRQGTLRVATASASSSA